MSKNLAAVEVPQQVIDEATKKFTEGWALLKPYLLTRTPEERKEGVRLGDKSVSYIDKSQNYCKSNKEFIPGYMDADALQVNVTNVKGLTPLVSLMEQIADNINDTVVISGNEAYTSALMYYNAVKRAADDGITSALPIYTDLSARFPGRKPKKEPVE